MKKIMTKFIIQITQTVLVSLIFLAIVTPIHAANVKLFLDPTTVAKKTGEQFTADIKLKTPDTTYDISAFNITVIYNYHILDIISVTPGKDFDTEVATSINNGFGSLHFARLNSGLNNVTGDITLGTITFQSKTAGTAKVEFKNMQITASRYLGVLPIDSTPGSYIFTGAYSSSYQNPNKCRENGVEGVKSDLGCLPTTPLGFVVKFYTFGLSLIGGVALLLLMYSGYLTLTSKGNSEMIGRAKKYMFYAISGLLLAILGYVLIKILLGTILKIPGFS